MNKATLQKLLDARSQVRFGTRLAWEAAVTVGARHDLGDGPLGRRFMVPITGGIFRGGPDHPDFHGMVLAGGADRQLLRRDGVKELEAIYEMQVHDGAVLQIRNEVIVDRPDSPDRYAVSRIRVAAPNGPWAWLNRRFFLGSLQSGRPDGDFVVVRGWEVLCG